jgi:hypothetical protein
MITAEPAILDELEEALREHVPAPEDEIRVICSVLAEAMPGTETGAKLRRLAFDLDHLLVETRWHIGQVLLLMRLHPDALKSPPVKDEWDEIERKFGMPAPALLLIRQFTRDADQVYYSNLAQRRGGGTVAAWVYHMLVDSAIFRIVAALDRVAHLAWLVARMPLERAGREIRVYFRSGKMKQINDTLNTTETLQLQQLASDPFIEKLVAYRDGLSHNLKSYVRAAGPIPTDEWLDKAGNPIIQQADQIDADLLFGITVSGYLHVAKTLKPLADLLVRLFPTTTKS